MGFDGEGDRSDLTYREYLSMFMFVCSRLDLHDLQIIKIACPQEKDFLEKKDFLEIDYCRS